jgi:hypothetical protein
MSSEAQARIQALDPGWHERFMRELVTQNSRRGIQPNHYHTGFPAMDEDEWVLAIALEEKKNGNPIFEQWLPHQQLPRRLREWCEEEYRKLIYISIEKLRVYEEAVKKGCRPSYAKKLYSQVPLYPEWSSRTAEGKLKWKSARTNTPNVTIGVAPASGFSGGDKYEDTLSYVFGVVTPRSKVEVQAILAERIAVRPDLFPDKSENETWLEYVKHRWVTWRQKVRKLLKYFGGGLWGTWNQKAKEYSKEELEPLQSKAREVRIQSQKRSPYQQLWWQLLETLPKCVPNYDDPGECPVWKYVSSHPERLQILKTIQERSESATKLKLEPKKYLHYILKFRANFIPSEHKRPVYDRKHFKSNYLQGKSWYPREDFQNAHRQTFAEFEEFVSTLRDVFYFDDPQYVLNLVVESGDMLKDQDQIVGINTYNGEQLKKRQQNSFSQAYSANNRHYRDLIAKVLDGCDILGVTSEAVSETCEGISNVIRPWLLKLVDPTSHVHKTMLQLPPSTERAPGVNPAEWISAKSTHWNEDGTVCYTLRGYEDNAAQLLISAAIEEGLVVWTNEYGDEIEYVGKQYDGERELTVESVA